MAPAVSAARSRFCLKSAGQYGKREVDGQPCGSLTMGGVDGHGDRPLLGYHAGRYIASQSGYVLGRPSMTSRGPRLDLGTI